MNATFIPRMLSAVFRPSFYPLVVFVILFSLTYMHEFPWEFKLWALSSVYAFTIAIPYVLIWLIRKANHWQAKDIYVQHRRFIVYTVNIISYISCIIVCQSFYLPAITISVLNVSLMAQILCVIVNFWYKVSMRSAGTGLAIGTLLAYSHLFHFNPTWWLCVAILISGAVMSSRMILVDHKLGEVLLGTLIGIGCGFCGIIV